MKRGILLLLFCCLFSDFSAQTLSAEASIEKSLKDVFDNIAKANSVELIYKVGFATDNDGQYTYSKVTFIRNLSCSKAITEVFDTYISDSIYFKVMKQEKEILFLKSNPNNLEQFETLGGDIQFNPLGKAGFKVDVANTNLANNLIVLNGSKEIGISKAYIKIDGDRNLPVSLEYFYMNGSRFKIIFEKVLINQHKGWDCDIQNFFTPEKNEIKVNPKYADYKLIKL